MSDNIKISGDNPVFNDLGVDKVSFNPNTLKPPLQDDVGAFKKILGGNDNDKKKPSSSHSADDISKANGNKNERVDDPIRHFFKDHESDSLEDFDGQNLPGSSYGLIGEVADEASGRQELGASAQEDALLSQESGFDHGTGGIGEVADEVSGRQRLGASAKEDALLSQENAFGHGTGGIGEVADEASGRQRLGASAKEDALLSQENAF
ncbi:MAG: hypothetical protein LBH49_02935, partial [Puniceicoccales bacterium]|nr:hypothetical protein [Puniceicoccales bacterium]